MKKLFLLLFSVQLGLQMTFLDAENLSITPSEWDFGTIPDTETVTCEMTLNNSGNERIRVDFVPTCECLFVEPSTVTVDPNSENAVLMTFDPAGYSGEIELYFVVITSIPGLEKALFLVRGEVKTIQLLQQNKGKVQEIVFIDLDDCCDCMRKDIEVSMDALMNVIGHDSGIEIIQIHYDKEMSKAATYLKDRPIFMVPVIIFLDDSGEVLDFIQGAVPENMLRKMFDELNEQ